VGSCLAHAFGLTAEAPSILTLRWKVEYTFFHGGSVRVTTPHSPKRNSKYKSHRIACDVSAGNAMHGMQCMECIAGMQCNAFVNACQAFVNAMHCIPAMHL
jgi:hypothetical protein